jgi:medium-chain acyl-[acyl-carrier-protein] hydrolase
MYNWMRGLSPVFQVCAIQLPGRENRRSEPPFRRMPPLVTQLTDAMEPHLETPFAFFGHSFGGLLAFEIARELRRRRCPGPVHFVASARAAPQLRSGVTPISGLPEPEFMVQIQRRYNAIPEAILADRDLMQMYLPVLRADLEILETHIHVAEAPLACSISVFGGSDDRTVTREQLEGWRLQTSGTFKLTMFPGDHFFPRMVRQSFVEAISTDLMPFACPPTHETSIE